MSRAHKIAQVLLDSALPQLDHLFDYAVPQAFQDEVAEGQRVKVPLRSGARQAFGYVVGFVDDSSHKGSLSEITQIVSPVQMLTPQLFSLARALADRAAGNANDIIRLAIPTRQVRVEKEYLKDRSDSTDCLHDVTDGLNEVSDVSHTPERIALSVPKSPLRLRTGEWCSGWAAELAQRAQHIHSRGKSVIVVVPDHHDLTMMLDALGAEGVDEQHLVRVDAQQSNAQRYRSFLNLLELVPRIIVGNRSAVYAPAPALGAIFIWDDADPLLNEPLSPYVHARDAAIMRSELENCDLVFAAHLRSLETHRLVRLGYVEDRQAAMHDDKEARRVIAQSDPDQSFSERLPALARKSIVSALDQGPVLVQVSSPGRAKAMFCRACSRRQRCSSCGGPLTPGTGSGKPESLTVTCRWCEKQFPQHACEGCGETRFRLSGAGSELTVEQFQQQFPNHSIKRSDAKNRIALVDSRPAIVVATRGAEPLAAEGYSAVVLLDAEHLLARESLRAEEDALRAWCNAAALARSNGIVVLANVQGKLADAFVLRKSEEWMTSVLLDRKILRFPPALRVASIRGNEIQVERAERRVCEISGVDSVLLSPSENGDARRVIRFPYSVGAEVASALRAEVVASALVSRRGGVSTNSQSRPVSRLRVHVDDREVFDGMF